MKEQTDHGQDLLENTNRTRNLLLVGILVVVGLLAAAANFFFTNMLCEIAGMAVLVFVFWWITEIMGWKSAAVPAEFNSCTCVENNTTAERMFRNLPENCAVFHNIDTGYGRIEHILLSKEHGFFVIETKHHPGKVTATDTFILINNLAPEQDFAAKILWYAFWLMERVRRSRGPEIKVTPVIVFDNAVVDVPEQVNGMIITDPDNFSANIRKAKIDPETAACLWTLHQSGELTW